MQITLKNGTIATVNRIRIECELTDSNGSAIGGATTFTLLADDVSTLPVQTLYDSVFATESTEESAETATETEETDE